MNQLMNMFHNEFFKGGVGVALVGAVMVFLRQIPAQIWSILVRQLTVTVEVHNDSVLFDRTVKWLDNLPETRKARSVVAKISTAWSFSAIPVESSLTYSPATGDHILRIKGRYVRVKRSRSAQTSVAANGSQGIISAETIGFTYIGRSQAFGRQILDVVKDHHDKQIKQSQTVLHFRPNMWNSQQKSGIWNPAHIRACSGARSREGAGSRSDSSKLTRHVEGGAAGRFRVARRVPGAGCGNGGGAAERRREEVGAAPPTYAVGGRR